MLFFARGAGLASGSNPFNLLQCVRILCLGPVRCSTASYGRRSRWVKLTCGDLTRTHAPVEVWRVAPSALVYERSLKAELLQPGIDLHQNTDGSTMCKMVEISRL